MASELLSSSVCRPDTGENCTTAVLQQGTIRLHSSLLLHPPAARSQRFEGLYLRGPLLNVSASPPFLSASQLYRGSIHRTRVKIYSFCTTVLSPFNLQING